MFIQLCISSKELVQFTASKNLKLSYFGLSCLVSDIYKFKMHLKLNSWPNPAKSFNTSFEFVVAIFIKILGISIFL